jgi:hypothetical protein
MCGTHRIGVAVALALALGVSAGCAVGSQPTGGFGGDDGGGGGSWGSDGIPDGGFYANDSGPKDDKACAQQTTQKLCVGCCQRVHNGGFTTLHDAAKSCVCGSNGPCKTACANEFCADTASQSGDACSQCLNKNLAQGAPCYATVNSACQADPDCTAYESCYQPCTSKP